MIQNNARQTQAILLGAVTLISNATRVSYSKRPEANLRRVIQQNPPQANYGCLTIDLNYDSYQPNQGYLFLYDDSAMLISLKDFIRRQTPNSEPQWQQRYEQALVQEFITLRDSSVTTDAGR